MAATGIIYFPDLLFCNEGCIFILSLHPPSLHKSFCGYFLKLLLSHSILTPPFLHFNRIRKFGYPFPNQASQFKTAQYVVYFPEAN